MTRARWTSVAMLVAITVAATARGDDSSLSQDAEDALTAIDQAPTGAELGTVLASPALTTLAAIAAGDGTTDPGVQLRAIAALAQYISNPSDQANAHAALTALIGPSGYQTAQTGSDLLLLRAAIGSLGTVGATTNPEDVAALTPFLDHASRDIRTATARAMRDLGFASAVSALRTRYAVETVPQVQLAISEALRVLQP